MSVPAFPMPTYSVPTPRVTVGTVGNTNQTVLQVRDANCCNQLFWVLLPNPDDKFRSSQRQPPSTVQVFRKYSYFFT